MSLTTEQQQAAYAPDSVAVTAGAGTGKTHMLAERYLHHLRGHGLSPLEVVAVTFTLPAASELRVRIRERVEHDMPDRGDYLAELEAATIGTLHSLASRICREHPEAADVPPDFSVLDEREGALWAIDHLEAALATLPPDVFTDVPYSLMRPALSELLRDPHTAERALVCPTDNWEQLADAERARAWQALVADPAWTEAVATLRAVEGDSTDRQESRRREALEAVARIDEAIERGESPPEALAVLGGIDMRGGSKKKWPDGDFERAGDALKALRELVRDALKEGLVTLECGEPDERLRAMLPALRRAFGLVRAHLGEAKRQDRLLDFSDLEVHALRALEDPEVRAYYALRWKAFLVDEFQDTNPVQAELLDRLTAGTRLTVVGDEKQAIYGFRRADVAVFRRFQERIVADGGVKAQLSTSFRTHHALVDAINRVFAPVLGELRGDLNAARADAPHAGPHLRMIAISDEGKESSGVDSLRRAEAHRLAAEVASMLEAGLLVYDKKEKRERPLRPGDVAFLSRTWDPLELYGEALAAVGVPAVHAGGGDLMATREAMDGLALLRFLADPYDNLALAAVLRSPWFALSDRVLFQLVESLPERKMPWWKALASACPPELTRAKQVLGELLKAREEEAPMRLLQLADRACGYTAVLAGLPGSERRLADWRGFGELVRQLEAGAQDVFQVVRKLKRLLDAEVEFSRPPIEAGNAVSLMTVHAAKGLEWPVVVLPDLSRIPRGGSKVLYMDPTLGLALKLPGEEEKPPQSVLFQLLAARQAAAEEAERRRVYYVALTRVRDHLLLSSPELKGGALGFLQEGLEAAGVEPVLVPFEPAHAVAPPLMPPPALSAAQRLLLDPVGAPIDPALELELELGEYAMRTLEE